MLSLKPINFLSIQPWFKDFQKRSKCTELPPKGHEILGIYRGEELIGYFIIVCYTSGVVEINQGYLKPEARHKNLSKISMRLLEDLAKQKGFKKIMLGTNRAVGSYQSFMRKMGYNLVRAIFSKDVN